MTLKVLTVGLALLFQVCTACKTAEWRNLTMNELLLKSDTVVYGKDVGHGKFRVPTEVDARFDVYCVLKTGAYNVPGQVIIENIRGFDECSGVMEQTQVNREYIVGLTRQFSGFMKYAEINPLQQTAFPATEANLDDVVATCGLDDWNPPFTGEQDMCPPANKPRFCTKVRFLEDVTNGCDRRASFQLMHLIFLPTLCSLLIDIQTNELFT